MAARPSSDRARDEVTDVARFWDGENSRPDPENLYWLEIEEVARAVNARVTGEPGVFPLADLARRLPAGGAARALVVGCGSGSLELELVRAGAVGQAHGIDLSEVALERARSLAAAAGLAEHIRYERADALAFLRAVPDRAYSLVLFHGSLHHVHPLEEVVAECARILRGTSPGLLYADEYVGPSRERWLESDLTAARSHFDPLPAEVKRTDRLAPPIAADDPSEMARSDEIELVLRAHFELAAHRPYGGSVLFPLIAHLRRSGRSHPAVRQAIRRALEEEATLAASPGAPSWFAVFIARPLEAAELERRGDLAAWVLAERARDARFLERALAVEAARRQELAECRQELRRVYREHGALEALRRRMESTRAWRLHAWLERWVRAPMRRRRGAPEESSVEETP